MVLSVCVLICRHDICIDILFYSSIILNTSVLRYSHTSLYVFKLLLLIDEKYSRHHILLVHSPCNAQFWNPLHKKWWCIIPLCRVILFFFFQPDNLPISGISLCMCMGWDSILGIYRMVQRITLTNPWKGLMNNIR